MLNQAYKRGLILGAASFKSNYGLDKKYSLKKRELIKIFNFCLKEKILYIDSSNDYRLTNFSNYNKSIKKFKIILKINFNFLKKKTFRQLKNEIFLLVHNFLSKNKIKNLKTEYVLGFFGLIMQLGPIANWGLNLNKKTIEVDTEKFETNQKGIYAVGDICNYPGKLKLILSGFHEGALAARACFKLARPDEKYRFEFTTTSTNLLKRLGKKE